MARLHRSKENALLAALGNPVRRQILRRLRDEEMVSARQLAVESTRSLSTMAYHLRVLADCGAVTLARVQPSRGSLQHFYRSSLEPPWARQIIDLEPWDGNPTGETPDPPPT